MAAAIPEICQEFATLVGQAAGRAVKLAAIERFAFYQRARDASPSSPTGETRLYRQSAAAQGRHSPGLSAGGSLKPVARIAATTAFSWSALRSSGGRRTSQDSLPV